MERPRKQRQSGWEQSREPINGARRSWCRSSEGDRVLGGLAIEDHEREHAYGDSDVRLLSTIAASMGVALENVRLFNETQGGAGTSDGDGRDPFVDERVDDRHTAGVRRHRAQPAAAVRYRIRNGRLVRTADSRWLGSRAHPASSEGWRSYPLPLDDRPHREDRSSPGKMSQLTPIIGNPETPPRTEQFGREIRLQLADRGADGAGRKGDRRHWHRAPRCRPVRRQGRSLLSSPSLIRR